MSCIQQQSPTPVHAGLPALRINTDMGLRKASFEEINSAPVTRKELGYQDVAQQQYSPSVAFTSNNWRSTMAAPPYPPGTSSSEDPSPERIFSNEDALANTSGSSDHRVSPVNQAESNVSTRGRNGNVSSPLVSEASSGCTSGGSTGTPPTVREAALARIISHGYSTAGTLNGKAPGSADRVDIFEVLPAAINAEGRAVCQHHSEHGICDCEAFPLVKINLPSPMSRSNRVCYPIQEVDESQTEAQPSADAGLTPKVSPSTAAKGREDDEKRQLEAARFEGLLGKLRRSGEDKRSKLIREWKDPITGRSEPLATWDKKTYLDWSKRFNEYKDMVYTDYAPGHDRPVAADEQSAGSRPTVPKLPEPDVTSPSKPSPVGFKMGHPASKLPTAWNPKAKEFSPPKIGDLGAAGKAAGEKARELLTKFVSEAKSREAGRGSDKKSTTSASAAASPRPFAPKTTPVHHDTVTPPFGVTPSLAQMFPGITPLALSALGMSDTPLSGLSTPGLGGSKFDYNPLNGFGALNQSLGGTMAGGSGLGTPGVAGLGGNLGTQRPFPQTFPGAANSIPPAPSRAPPGPVPKPRLPDAQAQQQYEQWIEWRKANEPGYALECKARQARRAQRTKPTSGSSLKAESGGGTNGEESSTSRSGDSKTD